MSKAARDVLIKYWGYSSFRPLQEDIVDAVIAGNDTLALLPTGGGKSVCFQVPALVMDGMCLVITPLIALMKDQVQNLKKLGIPAAAVFSGLHYNEIEIIYNQSVFGQLKFLYISPERLVTDRFIELLRRMKINLIAVDESHCISQWGYDFRPPYLQIADARLYLPKVPVLALTATATPKVVEDIQQKLHFKKPNVFQTSYERKNLTYNVIHHADKFGMLIRVFRNMTSGSGIVYVRNRKRTREMADYLSSRDISATYYHAGLEAKQRDERQRSWMKGHFKVMVATNAFGMGIDKPDVRLVVHMDLPDSLEAYFQEAGRGGRDGKDSQAYLLVSEQDVKQLKSNFESSYPELKQIRAIYQAVGNYLQIPVGGGKDLSFNFQLSEFAKNYNFPLLDVYNTLQLLEKEGLLMMSEGLRTSPRLFVKAGKEDLYRFQVEQPAFDAFIKMILRNYPGVFTDFVNINEDEMARKMGIGAEKVIEILNQLQKLSFLTYLPRKDQPQLLFLSERRDPSDLQLSRENYADRKVTAAKRLQAVIDFVHNEDQCRSLQLLAYFGEKYDRRCGKCDVCIKRNRLNLTDIEYGNISKKLKSLLSQRAYPLYEAISGVPEYPEEKVLEAIRWMIDNRILVKDEHDHLAIRRQLDIE
ncbi:MAG: RecQ family ATP-dependent DNA helicase [Bacteroidetes bacterium]|jgi:ATP-dependent DNA helicase RecQ|nr:RecQ family ATP-dependent DNA helicase [Bacteroidota bacterium]